MTRYTRDKNGLLWPVGTVAKTKENGTLELLWGAERVVCMAHTQAFAPVGLIQSIENCRTLLLELSFPEMPSGYDWGRELCGPLPAGEDIKEMTLTRSYSGGTGAIVAWANLFFRDNSSDLVAGSIDRLHEARFEIKRGRWIPLTLALEIMASHAWIDEA